MNNFPAWTLLPLSLSLSPVRLRARAAIACSFGLLGHPSELVFVSPFSLAPGAHTVEAVLGSSWGEPLSAATRLEASFTLLALHDTCTIPASDPVGAAVGAEPRGRSDVGSGGSSSGGGGRGGVVVVDAFPLFNELGLLEARLLELDKVGAQCRCTGLGRLIQEKDCHVHGHGRTRPWKPGAGLTVGCLSRWLLILPTPAGGGCVRGGGVGNDACGAGQAAALS